MLGEEQPVILKLLEVPQAMNALNGVVMELEDLASPLVEKIVATDDPKEAFTGADIAIFVGAKPRGKGQERADVLKDNAKIFAEQGKVCLFLKSKFFLVFKYICKSRSFSISCWKSSKY